MSPLSHAQFRSFAKDGFLLLPGVIDSSELDQADAELARLMAHDPPPVGTAGHHFYWLTASQALPTMRLAEPLDRILAAARELAAPQPIGVAFDQVQVALNIPPYPHRPGRPHIDGDNPGGTPGTFTMLAALMLSDQETENGGNLWVWPGTHLTHAAFFAEHGPAAFTGYPDVDLPEPKQILGRRGDVLLAHYLLGHNIGGNTSDRTRVALYWRLQAAGHTARWQACLTDPWQEYEAVRRTVNEA